MRVNIALLTVTDTRTLKTDKSGNTLVQKIIKAVKMLHSYEVPCIIFFDIKNGNTDFLKWIIKSV